MKADFPLSRVPLMALAGLALLGALWAGLVRLGWHLPRLPVPLAAQHGPLMISGFLGTLITLERAVALGQRGGKFLAAYLAPALTGLGAVIFLVGFLPPLAPVLKTLGAAGLTLIFVAINRRQLDAANATMGLGALSWLVGNGLWLMQAPIAQVVPWWAGFLILTIAGERLELARVLLLGRLPRITFIVLIGAFLAGLLISLPASDLGQRVSGAALAALGVWFLRFDLARRTIRQSGLTRFIAACMLPGYVWLALGGLLWLVLGGRYAAGPLYDALLHSLFLGFVISMVFGHAPLIVPAVLRVAIPYRSYFYLHLALLHVSLMVRIAGDAAVNPALRMWGGLFNAVAILLFLANTARAARSQFNAPSAEASGGIS